MRQTAAIGIMCKAPRPGRTKTRLAASVGAEGAAKLSACFLRDLAATIEGLPQDLARKGYAVYAPAGSEAELRALFPASFDLLLQADCEFGKVLYGAVRDLLEIGHDCVVLVNGDSPTLPPALLSAAINALRQAGDRVVLGPASDGGYYLIGLKHSHRRLFEEIDWGTQVVGQQTLARAREIGLESVKLPEWYDVDDLEALDWLRSELAGGLVRFRGGGAAPATRAYLAETAGFES
jgi:rSAM/selenodomain-associated transferase 1